VARIGFEIQMDVATVGRAQMAECGVQPGRTLARQVMPTVGRTGMCSIQAVATTTFTQAVDAVRKSSDSENSLNQLLLTR
jgi:hypothetical protein